MKEAATRFTTDALVIKEMNLGESDRLVTLLTRDFGVIKAFAAGAKNIKSKKGAATGLLAYSSVTILKKKDTYKIYEATPINVFFGAGSDIVSLSLSQYFCELCIVIAPHEIDTGSEEFLRLILNSLYFLTKKLRNPLFIKAITELRVMAISGYMPNLIGCDVCGKFEDDIMYLSLVNGSLLCKDCRSGDYLMPLDKTLLSALRHIVYSEFKNLYSFEIPVEKAEALSEITEKYVIMQTDHRFATLDFYKSIV